MNRSLKIELGIICGVVGVTFSSAVLCLLPNFVSASETPMLIDTVPILIASSCSIYRNTGDGAYSGNMVVGQTSVFTGSTFRVTCNDAGGYSIYAMGYSNNIDGNTDLVAASALASTNIATGITTSGNASSWSMKLTAGTDESVIQNGYNNYSVIPSSYTRIIDKPSGTAPANTTTATVDYRVFISNTQPSGSYVGKVKYALVHPSSRSCPSGYILNNGVCVATCGNVVRMQDITASYISNMTIDAQVQMCDSRDGKKYYVAKLQDGHVWMTQNLDLDITAAGLTDIDTDLNAKPSWGSNFSYPPQATLSTITSVSISETSTYSWNLGDYAHDESNSSNCGTEATSYADCLSYGFSSTDSPLDSANHYHVGNFYQFNAASAGTGYISASGYSQDSICPKGWRLPTYGTGSDEFQTLFSTYGATNDSDILFGAPIYLVRSGHIQSGFLQDAGYQSIYLAVSKKGNDDNSYGGNVRCIAR